MKIETLDIPDVKVIFPTIHSDDRGFFSETYNRFVLSEFGINVEFVQDNHSLSRQVGVIRGLHFQIPPFTQGKLIRVVRGSVYDVAVDVRRGSPSYGKFVDAVLSAQSWNQLWVPEGFAHGICTLEPDTEVIYKVTSPYAPDHDRGLAWDDPDLGIKWPVVAGGHVLSDKDRRQPRLKDLPAVFEYSGPGSFSASDT